MRKKRKRQACRRLSRWSNQKPLTILSWGVFLAAMIYCLRVYKTVDTSRYRADGNWKRYTEGFLKYLATQDDAVAELAALAATTNCALLCYEADHNFCHRSMVADAVKRQFRARVQHLRRAIANRKSTRHPERSRIPIRGNAGRRQIRAGKRLGSPIDAPRPTKPRPDC